MNKITVARRNTPKAIYIGRPSPLGNPFVIGVDGDRNSVCDAYEIWIDNQVRSQNQSVVDELEKLTQLAQKGDLVLGCYCSPQRCHGDTIKRIVEDRIREQENAL